MFTTQIPAVHSTLLTSCRKAHLFNKRTLFICTCTCVSISMDHLMVISILCSDIEEHIHHRGHEGMTSPRS